MFVSFPSDVFLRILSECSLKGALSLGAVSPFLTVFSTSLTLSSNRHAKSYGTS